MYQMLVASMRNVDLALGNQLLGTFVINQTEANPQTLQHSQDIFSVLRQEWRAHEEPVAVKPMGREGARC